MLVQSNDCSELSNIQTEHLTCLFLYMKFLIFPPHFYVLDQKSWVIILWNAGGNCCLEEAKGSGRMSVFANSCNEHRFLPLVPAKQCLLSVCAPSIRNHPSAPASLAKLLHPSVFSLDLVNCSLSWLFLVLVVLGQLSPLCEGKQLCLVKHLPSFPCVGFLTFSSWRGFLTAAELLPACDRARWSL